MQRRTLLSGMAAVSTAAIMGRPVNSAQRSTLHTVEIANFEFSPSTLQVKPGDRVKWVNLDIVPHTATANNSSWDTGELKPNESAEILIKAKQSEPYFCAFHPNMKATLQLV